MPGGPDDLVVASQPLRTAPRPAPDGRGNGVCGRGDRPTCSLRRTSCFEVHRPLTD